MEGATSYNLKDNLSKQVNRRHYCPYTFETSSNNLGAAKKVAPPGIEPGHLALAASALAIELLAELNLATITIFSLSLFIWQQP